MLLLPALLLMMKIRLGDGWTVVCSKKRQNKKNLNGKNDLGKGGFFNSGKEKSCRVLRGLQFKIFLQVPSQ